MSSNPPSPIDVVITRHGKNTLVMKAKPGLLLVKAPTLCSEEEISNFIAQRKNWIEIHCARKQKKHLYFGKPIAWQDHANTLGADLSEQDKDRVHRRACHAGLQDLFDLTLKDLGHRAVPMRICSMASSWGKCHSSGRIELHWKVAELPERLAKYVICHELAHLKHFDHTGAFWAAVDDLDPGARRHDRELSSWSLA